jgi:acrylyl-CoA reductase (NADPH)
MDTVIFRGTFPAMSFPALYLTHGDSGVEAGIRELDEMELPPGDVLIDVSHSTLNYKDALAITRGAPVVRQFPMVPGIDLAGVVRESSSAEFRPGDAVMVNGHGLGEERWGGLAQMARVPADFITRIPAGLSAADTMAVGTAGYTAALCLLALERGGLDPGAGEVLVTGASGGVGSFAILLLAATGYRVTASTGRSEEESYLKSLGAEKIIARRELASPGKPLQKERWAAAIDCVGGHTLANVCASVHRRGLVAACGLAHGMDFPATVAPFILRGVTLYGIESVHAPPAERDAAWQRIARKLDLEKLREIATEITLQDAIPRAHDLLAGKVRGRLTVNLRG